MSRFKRDVVVNISDDWIGEVPYMQVQKILGRFASFQGDAFNYVHVTEDITGPKGSLVASFKREIDPGRKADYVLKAEYIKSKGTYRYYT